MFTDYVGMQYKHYIIYYIGQLKLHAHIPGGLQDSPCKVQQAL